MIRLKQSKAENNSCCELREFCDIDFSPDFEKAEIEYYDDHELDVFRGFEADSYTVEAIEQFREVLYTLLENDISGWIHSLHLRKINLPNPLKDEALLMLSGKFKEKNPI